MNITKNLFGADSYLAPTLTELSVRAEAGFVQSGFTNDDITEREGEWDD